MLEEIIDAVRRGGGIILSAQSPENYTSVKEGKANYVTRYDVAVQNFLKEELLKIAPQAQFIGEEGDADQAEPDRPAFVVDPIDGTTNFIKGYRKSCIAVAYTENGAVQIGVVLNPFTGELFYAKAGSGAFLNGRRLAASQRPLSEELAAFGTSPYYPELVDVSYDTAKYLQGAALDIRRSGSAALDLCDPAAGRIGLYFEYRLSPWDYAAGSLIAQEAGAKVTRMDGSPLSFFEGGSLLAGGPAAYEDFMQSAFVRSGKTKA